MSNKCNQTKSAENKCKGGHEDVYKELKHRSAIFYTEI